MSCDILVALPKVPFDFSTTVTHGTRTQVLARFVCVEGVRELTLVVRVHDVDAGSGSLSVWMVAAAPTEEDPDVDFAAETALASVLVNDAKPGGLLRAVAYPPLSRFVQLQIRAEQALAVGPLWATLSMELGAKR